jgi:hypothetical protein
VITPEHEMEALQALGAEAAPAQGPLPHVPDAELARIRVGDESEALSAAYRHVASCAVCRARVLEPALPEPIARALRGASSGARAPVAALALPRRRGPFLALFAAAAGVALVVGVGAFLRRDEGPVTISQRAYVGMMGADDADAPAVGAEDADVELSFAAPPGVAAAVVVVDSGGRALSPVRSFARPQGGRLVAVLAPRTFAAHAGPAFGLIVMGDSSRVREAAEGVGTGAFGSVDAAEEAIRARGLGVRVERVEIAERLRKE